jgi:hypothetical protein
MKFGFQQLVLRCENGVQQVLEIFAVLAVLIGFLLHVVQHTIANELLAEIMVTNGLRHGSRFGL